MLPPPHTWRRSRRDRSFREQDPGGHHRATTAAKHDRVLGSGNSGQRPEDDHPQTNSPSPVLPVAPASSPPSVLFVCVPKHAGHVATGWALVSDQPRLVLQGCDPDHLVHRGLAPWARHTTSSLRKVRHDKRSPCRVFPSLTSVNASWSGLVAALRPVCFR
jgi:hypothetical protein